MGDLFNRKLLSIARQSRNFSQAQLSEITGISQGHLSKIEHGTISDPSDEYVDKLSEALNYPRSFFYQSDRIYGAPLSVHPMFRKSNAVGKKMISKVSADLNLWIMGIKRLLQSIEFKPQFVVPRYDPEEDDGDIESFANSVRRSWMLPDGPIDNLTEALERAGIIIIWCDFGDLSIDAISLPELEVDNLPACILVNRNRPSDRIRFSLAHELGHIVMHRIPNQNMENEANQFASAFLMPKHSIRKYFSGRITLPALAKLKPIWKVSIQSLLFRCQAIGAITPNQARYLWSQINSHNIRIREPRELDIPYEYPSILPEIVKVHLNDLGFSEQELASILNLHLEEFVRLYSLAGADLNRKNLKFKVIG
jgi:Zn-dependent peptidase ImmA (M78 family)/transcriptional regulator with XRE-family HTH domain